MKTDVWVCRGLNVAKISTVKSVSNNGAKAFRGFLLQKAAASFRPALLNQIGVGGCEMISAVHNVLWQAVQSERQGV